ALTAARDVLGVRTARRVDEARANRTVDAASQALATRAIAKANRLRGEQRPTAALLVLAKIWQLDVSHPDATRLSTEVAGDVRARAVSRIDIGPVALDEPLSWLGPIDAARIGSGLSPAFLV